ncbi:Rv3235 family protein [Nocardioides sp.]|uniref:Rv3235 family protein n=1 Tax=Nocardioides sp. TaxID=35761 RepID=UPI003566D885
MSPYHPKVVPLRTPVPIASVQGTLALDLQPRQDPPPLHDTSLAPGADPVGADLKLRRQVEQWARRYAQAAVEIVGGDRPVSQLVRWSTREVYLDLERRAQLVARAGGHQPGLARVQPVRPVVVSVRACFLSPAIAEVGVHVRYGQRSRAIAARFEQRRDPWLCSALAFA